MLLSAREVFRAAFCPVGLEWNEQERVIVSWVRVGTDVLRTQLGVLDRGATWSAFCFRRLIHIAEGHISGSLETCKEASNLEERCW